MKGGDKRGEEGKLEVEEAEASAEYVEVAGEGSVEISEEIAGSVAIGIAGSGGNMGVVRGKNRRLKSDEGNGVGELVVLMW